MEKRLDKIYNTVSPLSLAAIVMLNFLLIYMNLASLENQNRLLYEIQNNTERVGEAIEIMRKNDAVQETAFKNIQSQHENTTKSIGEVQAIQLAAIVHLNNLTEQVADTQKAVIENRTGE